MALRNHFSRASTILRSLRRALSTKGARVPATRAPSEEAKPLLRMEQAAPIVNDYAGPREIVAPPEKPAIFEEFIEEYSMVRLSRRSLRMAVSTARAGADAAVTIAARTQGLLTPSLDGFGAQAHEAHRMVEEKVVAACEGLFAAQVAWGTFLVSAAFGGVRTAEDVTLGFADVAEAAVAPAHRTVRANARRLTGA
jgi:hypothetical protein